jgi:predicted ATPase
MCRVSLFEEAGRRPASLNTTTHGRWAGLDRMKVGFMSELAAGFQSLPEAYQQVILLAQERYNITVTPLQALSGGYSGAMIYLVSVSFDAPQRVEHLILKLDRKSEKARTDEIRRHGDAVSRSPADFSRRHMAQMMFERVEHEGAMAIFYAVAGQSLHQYRPLSAFDRQTQLETLFVESYQHLLEDWNADHTIQQALHPQQILEQWLGFRIKPGAPIETFLAEDCAVPPDMPGFLLHGSIMPNPLAYARDPLLWEPARPLDAAVGLQHGDLNTNNILVKFDRSGEALEGFYLIDFALFKEDMPLLYDLRYLEASYLVFRPSQVALRKLTDLILRYGDVDILDPEQSPVDVAGVCAVINASRRVFERWVSDNHPSLRDDLWGQYLLAGIAAGLNFTHKAALSYDERMLGFIFASTNLKRYADLFGVPAPAEGRQLNYPRQQQEGRRYASSNASPSPAVNRASAGKAPHNLPAQYSTFIGREAELSAACEMLTAPNVRLVTFTGPGGVGKTRLALQTAACLLDSFPDGIYLVPLAEITEPELLISRIAQTLGVRVSSQPLLETLKDFLQETRLLLLLDNLEQVVKAAPVIVDLLASTPGLKVLATSRVVLQVRGEHEFPVPPMKTPAGNGQPDDQPLEAVESVQLFVDRAREANPRFSLTDETAPAVKEICRRLDGLPLAIELAAARIKLFPPQALLNRLSNRLAVLTGGARDLPARQQTLRSTLDWSYSLLSEDNQILFARLGVFVGGFSLEGAEAVCNGGESLDVLAGVEALMNNSLLRQEGGLDAQPRFRMLEMMREYALERLKERGELTEIQRSHAYYYINKVNNDVALFTSEALYWLDWLESEHDNLQAVLAWGETNLDETDMITFMAGQLVWFWYRRGYFEEGRTWTERWLKLTEGQGRTTMRALALQNGASMANWGGELKTAMTRNEESLNILMQLEDERWLPLALFNKGVVHINMGNDANALPLIREAQFMYEEMGIDWFNAVTLVHLGNASLGLGKLQEAREWLDKAFRISCGLGEPWISSFVLNNLGEVARVQGDYTSARRYYQESEALLRSMGDKGDLARLVNNQGYIAQHEGNTAAAKARFHESLMMFRRLGHKRGIAEAMAGIAGLRQVEGRADQAAVLLSAAEAMMADSGAAWWPADRVEIDRSRAATEAVLGQSLFAAAWDKGQSMTYDQAVALALDDRY